jgi:hypothetical protein
MSQPRRQLRRPAAQTRAEQEAQPQAAPLTTEGAAAAEAARAARERLLDEALAPLAGEAEVLGGAVVRPELRDRAEADEAYVRMFRQPGGE